MAARLAASHKIVFALGVAFFFLLGGITMVAMVGGQAWFAVADLVGAYLPMGYLGGRIAQTCGLSQRGASVEETICPIEFNG